MILIPRANCSNNGIELGIQNGYYMIIFSLDFKNVFNFY